MKSESPAAREKLEGGQTPFGVERAKMELEEKRERKRECADGGIEQLRSSRRTWYGIRSGYRPPGSRADEECAQRPRICSRRPLKSVRWTAATPTARAKTDGRIAHTQPRRPCPSSPLKRFVRTLNAPSAQGPSKANYAKPQDIAQHIKRTVSTRTRDAIPASKILLPQE